MFWLAVAASVAEASTAVLAADIAPWRERGPLIPSSYTGASRRTPRVTPDATRASHTWVRTVSRDRRRARLASTAASVSWTLWAAEGGSGPGEASRRSVPSRPGRGWTPPGGPAGGRGGRRAAARPGAGSGPAPRTRPARAARHSRTGAVGGSHGAGSWVERRSAVTMA